MTLRKWGIETLVNTSTGSFSGVSQYGSVVTSLADGRYVVGWSSGDESTNDGLGIGPMLQIFSADGKKVGTEFNSWPLPNPSGIDPLFDLVTLQNGSLLQLYAIGAVLQAADVTIDVSGSSLSLGTSLSSAILGSNLPSAADANQTGLILYHGGVLKKYNASNTFLWSLPTSVYYQADVALLQNGNVVLTYFDAQQVFYKVYNGSTGAVVSTGGAVSPTANSGHGSPVVTALAGGGFVISYKDAFGAAAGAGPDPSGTGIVHQVFNADGTVASLPLLTNTYTSGNQAEPAIAALNDGGFIVVYYSDFDIRAQAFNADGTKRGSEVLVNTTTVDLQTDPSVEVLSDGRVVVTWTDYSQTGGDTNGSAIRQQILDPRDGIVFGTDNAALAETLYGSDSLGDEINGLAGNDTLFGLAGADVIYGGIGSDFIYGGRGDDTLYGDAGVDNIEGGLGDDESYGGADNDQFFGSVGADYANGDTGTSDFLNYQASNAGVTVNLTTLTASGGFADGDTFENIDGIQGSAFNDTLTGDAGNNFLAGLGGTNTINGLNGNDSIRGGTGIDTIDGGNQTDQIVYAFSNAAVTVNLAVANGQSGGHAAGDILTNIEDILGSVFGDTLTGNALANTINGYSGNDTIRGGGGADVLISGGGFDSFVFAAGDSGQAVNFDRISDFGKGAVGVGDEIDYSAALTVGGTAAPATATQASINAATGVATFLAGSGTTISDALNDIVTSMTTGGNAAGEFAFFQIAGAGDHYMFISDGVGGLGANDVVIRLTGLTSIGSIDLTSGDLTILT